MHVVGLTGGVATGKSTVARLLAERHGVPVIDLDQVAREVVAPGSPVLAAIAERFGADSLDAHGALDRAAMRRRIATDPEARRDLEALTHPAIRDVAARRLARLAEAGAAYAVVEAALMVETGSYRLYPTLLVVSCAPETQLDRLIGRDGQPEDEARALIAAQLPLRDKEAFATHVIRNDGDLDDLVRAVDAVWARVTRDQ